VAIVPAVWKIIYTASAWVPGMSFHDGKHSAQRIGGFAGMNKSIYINMIKKLAGTYVLYIITATV
jgi:hypothetical protein